MANPEHVAVVKKGADAIAEWRAKNPDERFDLIDANLEEADLGEANLSGADLSGAKLGGTKLGGANLNRADLSAADLSAADLSEADVGEANLSGADLSGANLSGTQLFGTQFFRAKLYAADLSRANCYATAFANVDLSSVVGLESILHRGPSTIGVDTLFKSQGKIPELFLHDCGVPDELIAYLPAMLGAKDAFQFYSCFISYSSKDEQFCKRLYSRMRDEKLRVWFAPEDIKGGDYLHSQIDRAIQAHDRLLLVLSEDSLASEWVKREVRKAIDREKQEQRRILFPVRLVSYDSIKSHDWFDGKLQIDLAEEICKYYIPDFSAWKHHDKFETEFSRVLEALRESVE